MQGLDNSVDFGLFESSPVIPLQKNKLYAALAGKEMHNDSILSHLRVALLEALVTRVLDIEDSRLRCQSQYLRFDKQKEFVLTHSSPQRSPMVHFVRSEFV